MFFFLLFVTDSFRLAAGNTIQSTRHFLVHVYIDKLGKLFVNYIFLRLARNCLQG
jgi:hypothetical protein